MTVSPAHGHFALGCAGRLRTGLAGPARIGRIPIARVLDCRDLDIGFRRQTRRSGHGLSQRLLEVWDSDIKPVATRSEYWSVRAGSPENRTALVTISETINSAVCAASCVIPWQQSRNKRVYLRAQNGEVGSVASVNVPASFGRGWPRWADSHADPSAGPATGRAPGAVVAGVGLPWLAVPGGSWSRMLTGNGIGTCRNYRVAGALRGVLWGR